MTRKPLFWVTVLLFLPFCVPAAPALGQASGPTGKLRISVSPKQAYVFVDGEAFRDGRQTIALTPGAHEVLVENYGYLPNMQTVQIASGMTTPLNVTLQKSGGDVEGPFGDIEFKGHPRAAVLLNGTNPAFFVGHVDEFDNNWIWHQWLLVKPGTYQATIKEKGQTVWSGAIPVKAGQRVIVFLNQNGKMVTKDFKQGLTMKPHPRFEVGIASAQIPIAPVAAQLSASPTQTLGGQSASLMWKTTDAVETTISNIGTVPASGDRAVSPCQTTTYQLVAKGPGGEETPSATINVNSQPTATLSLSQSNVTYHRVGDKVVEQGSAALTWSSSNANSVTITPFGGVANSGSQSIQANPGQTTSGTISRDVTYTLQATNSCGGTVTRTATLHIEGSIDPAPVPPTIKLASVFYPSNYPDNRHMKVGLMSIEKNVLLQAAAEFKQYEAFPGSQPVELLIVGHADIRGTKGYNSTLSQRRAEIVKDYLVSQGIAADKIKLQADGKDNELDRKQVDSLQEENPQKPPEWMTKGTKAKTATWMAYNRRVDIILEPAGQQSVQEYPNDASDARVMWQRAQPSAQKVEADPGTNAPKGQ